MSRIKELEQRVGHIETELTDAERKLASWESKKRAALSEFEAALDEGDEAPHNESSVLQECRFAVNHFEAQVADRKRALQQAQRALMEARYDEGVVEIRQACQEAANEIEEIETELIEEIKGKFEAALEAQQVANAEVNSFNSRVVTAVGQKAERQIKKMNSLDEYRWVEAVMREAVASGEL